MAVTIYREIRADSPTLYRFNIRDFPVGDIQRKQTGAMIVHLSF
jgi:hypothetical protein